MEKCVLAANTQKLVSSAEFLLGMRNPSNFIDFRYFEYIQETMLVEKYKTCSG